MTGRVPAAAVREATLSDTPWLAGLAAHTPGSPHWTEAQFSSYLVTDEAGGTVHRVLFVAEQDSERVGFVAGTVVCGEAELESIAVAPQFRRQGVAAILLQQFHKWCAANGAATIRLEVRQSNTGAQALYLAAGYSRTGERPGYYMHPSENAVLMEFSRDNTCTSRQCGSHAEGGDNPGGIGLAGALE